MHEIQILACETEIRKILDWPESDEKTKWLQWDYSIWNEYKKKQLFEERYEILRNILAENPGYPHGLSKDERTLLIYKHCIIKELSRRPIEYVGLGIFVDAWWKLKNIIATETVDRLFPDCTPEERSATIHCLAQEGDPNP